VSQQRVNSNTQLLSPLNVIVYSKQSTIHSLSHTPIVILTSLGEDGFVPQTVIVCNSWIIRLIVLPSQSVYWYGNIRDEVLTNVKQLQVTLFVGVGVGVCVCVFVTVGVTVFVGVMLGVGLGLAPGVLVTVGVVVFVGVILGVNVWVWVFVGVWVTVGVLVGVDVGVGVTGT